MNFNSSNIRLRKPKWIRSEIVSGENYKILHSIKERYSINTVCEEAKCPNIGCCWKNKHITVMILGDSCTRNCFFCGVKKNAGKLSIDYSEPIRVSEALSEIMPEYIVLTSVTRDDIDDGGAFIFAESIKAIKEKMPKTIVEVLIPDFQGNIQSLEKIINVEPFVIGHNIETTKKLHKSVRPMSNYDISLNVLFNVKKISPKTITKSSFMVGLGETDEDVFEMFQDLKNVNVDIVHIGQYLSPEIKCFPVKKYVELDKFEEYKVMGEEIGIKVVESGPLVRSSYNAKKSFDFLSAFDI